MIKIAKDECRKGKKFYYFITTFVNRYEKWSDMATDFRESLDQSVAAESGSGSDHKF